MAASVGSEVLFAGGEYWDGSNSIESNVVDIYTVPEPSSLVLLLIGAIQSVIGVIPFSPPFAL